jgi:hypothetical protein
MPRRLRAQRVLHADFYLGQENAETMVIRVILIYQKGNFVGNGFLDVLLRHGFMTPACPFFLSGRRFLIPECPFAMQNRFHIMSWLPLVMKIRRFIARNRSFIMDRLQHMTRRPSDIACRRLCMTKERNFTT